jgi:exodeoxyribonuclease VII large subunit
LSCGNAARRAMLTLLDQRGARLERAERLLAAFSYREVLKRGFALVRDGDGNPLHSAAAVTSGARLDIEFADGRVAAVADGEGKPTPPAPAPRPKPRARSEGGGSSGQGSLFG